MNHKPSTKVNAKLAFTEKTQWMFLQEVGLSYEKSHLKLYL